MGQEGTQPASGDQATVRSILQRVPPTHSPIAPEHGWLLLRRPQMTPSAPPCSSGLPRPSGRLRAARLPLADPLLPEAPSSQARALRPPRSCPSPLSVAPPHPCWTGCGPGTAPTLAWSPVRLGPGSPLGEPHLQMHWDPTLHWPGSVPGAGGHSELEGGAAEPLPPFPLPTQFWGNGSPAHRPGWRWAVRTLDPNPGVGLSG